MALILKNFFEIPVEEHFKKQSLSSIKHQKHSDWL